MTSMTSWTANDLPDLTGRTVVITGAGRGLGLITARELARAGAHVVLGYATPTRPVTLSPTCPAPSTSDRSTCRT